ncbi:MAG: hypothetical protein IJR17_05920 [Clostridia bacterium]|nr:hypothetical protein [Clostridia bacterium]
MKKFEKAQLSAVALMGSIITTSGDIPGGSTTTETQPGSEKPGDNNTTL